MRWDFARAALLGALVSLPVSLAIVAVPLSSTVDASATDMLALTNQFRYAIGSPTVPTDPRLQQAAQNHANYNSANGILGHFETAGLPYYTGYGPRDRLIAQGWTTSFVSEVATGGSELGGVQQLWDAPYHRLGLMHPNATTIGWGHSELNGRQSNVGDIVYNFGLRPVEFLRSPANMQTNIPTSWSGHESPSPVPSGTSGPYGYPIMVVYSAGQSVQFRALGMNVGWPSANRVAVQNEASVGPGAVASFTFVVKAPFSAGTVRIPLRPVVDGVAWLEDQGVFVPVTTVVDYHSRWVAESAFPTLRVGQLSGPLSISFRNAGSQSWIRGTLGQEARLAVNQDNAQWAALGVNWLSANRVASQTEATVVPGGVGTFSFQVRAPMTPGLYAIHLRPVIDAVTWMEDEGVFLYITVTN